MASTEDEKVPAAEHGDDSDVEMEGTLRSLVCERNLGRCERDRFVYCSWIVTKAHNKPLFLRTSKGWKSMKKKSRRWT
jgi:hypothetical protein